MTTLAEAVRQSLTQPQSPEEAVRINLATAQGTPDAEAELQRISRETGVPLGAARTQSDALRRRQESSQALEQMRNRPRTTEFMAAPDRAAIARDDVGNLGALEDHVTGEMRAIDPGLLGGTLDAARRGFAEAEQNLTLLLRDFGLTRARGADAEAAQAARMAEQERVSRRWPMSPDVAAGLQAIMDAPTYTGVMAAVARHPRAAWESTVQSLAATAPALIGQLLMAPLGLAGRAAGGFIGAFATEYGATLQDVLAEQGVNVANVSELRDALANPLVMGRARDHAVLRGIPIAAFDGLSAGLAGKLLAGATRDAVSIAPRVAGEFALQTGAGGAGELGAQVMVDEFAPGVGKYSPGAVIMEMLGELPTAAVDVPMSWIAARDHAERAATRGAQLQRFSELAAATRVRARDTSGFHAFVQGLTDDGTAVDGFYIDAQALMQAGLANELAAQLPAVAEQLPTAAATGGAVHIPLADYAAHLAGTPIDAALLRHARVEPDGMSVAESEVFLQQAQEELLREVSRAIQDEAQEAPFRESMESVQSQVEEMLVQAGLRPAVARAYATLTSHFYGTMAARLGKTPQEVFEQYPQLVRGAGLEDGDVMAQERALRMMAVHNLSAESLLFAGRMGGLAMPSVAVSTADLPLDTFGEVTLLAPRGMVDPRAGARVFDADVYSPRYPDVELEIPAEAAGRAEELLAEAMGAVDQRAIDWRQVSRDGPDALASQAPFLWWFLSQQGVEPDVQRVAPAELAPALQAFADSGVDVLELRNDPAFEQAAWDAYRQVMLLAYEGREDALDARIESLRARQPGTGAASPVVRQAAREVEDHRRGARTAGEVDAPATRQALRQQVEGLGLGAELASAAERFVADMAVGERIPVGTTATGRQRYVPHTLDNVVRLLRRQPVRAGEGPVRGVGALRSRVAHQFRSITEMRGARDRIVPAEQMAQVQEEAYSEFAAVARAIDPQISPNTAMAILEDAISLGAQQAALAYGHRISEETATLLTEFLLKLANLPTGYFEAKIPRAVGLEEFAGAVIPKDASPAVRELLERAGLPFVEYDGPGQRTQAVREFAAALAEERGDVLFQATALRRGTETLRRYGLDPKKKHSTRDVAAALQARQRAKHGSIEPDDHGKDALSRIAKWMTEEVAFEMQNPEDSGVGWYSVQYQAALDLMGGLYPELLTDRTARNLMTALIAITSDGQKVMPNFAQALDIYGRFREGGETAGRFTSSRGHIRQAIINNNLQVLQQLHDTMGAVEMHEYLMQERPIGELKEIAAQIGRTFNPAYQVHIKLPMAAVEFGPKLGAFYANLMGAHGYLTMDRWWSRSFNRYRGTLLTSATAKSLRSFATLIGQPEMSDDQVLSAVVEPREALDHRGFRTVAALLLGRSEPSKKGEAAEWMAEIDALREPGALRAALERLRAEQQAIVDAGLNPRLRGGSRTKARTDARKAARTLESLGKLPGDYTVDQLLHDHAVERAANTIYKDAFEKIEDVAFGARDRTFMLAATAQARRNLARRGHPLTIADIQAILWYYEKRLYGGLGARQTADISYREAADRVVERFQAGTAADLLEYDPDPDAADQDDLEGEVPLGEEPFEAGDQELAQGEGARGSFNPRTNTIRLLRNADLSTYLHESGHFFLENLMVIAAEIGNRGGAVTPGEQGIIDDVRRLHDWFGVQGMPTWLALSFEEKRAYHERFAESFEAYLFRGEAPSIELQGVFQSFRAWLLGVYQSLKNFLRINPQAGKLNDEVRGVMDRLLATDAQIEMARRARSMMPIFASPEAGQMTPEEFEELQRLGAAEVGAARDELQTRGLRDMQWLRNARARELSRLQTASRELRRQARAGARNEVLSQPVYRAWQFLTGALSDEYKAALAAEERPKPKPGAVDPTVDSLFVAIAKLGGLDRAEVEAEWDLDPTTRVPMPLFGLHVLRRVGGKSIDGMAESLAGYGYLGVGAADLAGGRREALRVFENAFDAQLRGTPQYSVTVDARVLLPDAEPGTVIAPEMVDTARLSIAAMRDMGVSHEAIDALRAKRMTGADGVHPELVANLFGFETGDELIAALVAAPPPRAAIEAATDAAMFEQHAELATPEAIERAADEAVHGEARARFVTAEANALARMAAGGRAEGAGGRRRSIVPDAARQFAAAMVARLRIRNLRPAQYAGTAARAGIEAERAFRAADVERAAAEKRTQAVHTYATREAYRALREVERGVAYMRRFAKPGARRRLPPEYVDQIEALLERHELKERSLRTLDRRASLREWLDSQEEVGLVPEIDPALADDARTVNYKEMTVEEFRGLVDAVRAIEHLGRLKKRLLTSRDKREFEAVRDLIADSIVANSMRTITPRTATTWVGQVMAGLRRFVTSHYKAAAIGRILDGGKDGGPFWEYITRTANAAGDQEVQMRADATVRASAILAPLFAGGAFGGGRMSFAGIARPLNRGERLAIALNTGNEGNMQRLLGGENWTRDAIQPVLESLTAAELRAVQQVWDLFESYRPLIAAKEKRVYGKEPEWVPAVPFEVTSSDGEVVSMRGGYYPIKYDPAASARAEELVDADEARAMMRGAYTSDTTRRSFTKSRVKVVMGRPLLLTFDGLFQGLNEVIHDLSWHEWLIDVNRLMRADKIQQAIRQHYGPEMATELKRWKTDIAAGEPTAHNEESATWLRRNVSIAGLGYNLLTAAIQVTGVSNSLVRVGSRWMGPAIAQYARAPVTVTRETHARSSFMALRSRTQFLELNELRGRIQGGSSGMRALQAGAFLLIVKVQQLVDMPTWNAAYARALSEGSDDARAVALADQAVIDTQGSGMLKDQAGIERGGPYMKLFTVFYSYMNAVFNLAATSLASKKSRMEKAMDGLLLFTIPIVMTHFLREVLMPDIGEDEEDWGMLARKLAADHISMLMGTMILVRDLGNLGATLVGAESPMRAYAGTAGERLLSDLYGVAHQAGQGEFDTAFRKKMVNVLGTGVGLPSAQINRTWNGIEAMVEEETVNPAAILFGVER
ncbi:MAG TPA: hypothetical protein DCY89_05530 [Gammaproteobacteria bacterium]|nr:hypothetical protein [Gammaproteobacteria bacterium]